MAIKQRGGPTGTAARDRRTGQSARLRLRQVQRFALVAALGIGLLAAAKAGARELVGFDAPFRPGTIVIRTGERSLYYVAGNGAAIRYPVAVGKPGKQWYGEASVDGKYVEPAWSPPAEVKRDNPRLPNVIAGGSPGNPMGARALTLDRGEYAIHGTNRPGSIGTFASYGCIRMFNHDIIDLYGRVQVGTPVVVVR